MGSSKEVDLQNVKLLQETLIARSGAGNEMKQWLELADRLRYLRKLRAMTLREVAKKSGGVVSNPYLCNIEKGQIKQPSPNILFSLAEIYQVPYDELMELAGYHSARGSNQPLSIITNTISGLTDDEAKQLKSYLDFIRFNSTGR